MTGPRVRSSKDAWTADGGMSRRLMTDTSVAEFEKLKSQGVLICNAANSYKESFASKVKTGFRVEYRRKSDGYVHGSKDLFSLQSPAWRPSSTQWNNGVQATAYKSWKSTVLGSPPTANAIAAAHTDLSAKLSEGVASLLVTFAELDKTKGMVLRALNYLRRPLHDVLRRYKRMSGRDRMNKVNEWWLEGRYGWRPFIYDVGCILDAAGRTVGDRLTAKTRLPVSNGETEWNDRLYTYWGIQSMVKRRASLVSYYDLGQTADFKAGVIAAFRKYGWYDLVGAGWDLVPYSFVADWFCNVGAAARAMQAYALIDERVGWTKANVRVVSEIEHTMLTPYVIDWGVSLSVVTDVYGLGTHPHYEENAWDRVPVTTFLPTLGLRCNIDWLKVVDMAALLRNLLKKVRNMPG